MLWGENRRSEKRPAVTGSRTQDTPGLSHQCSATELRQLDNRQPLTGHVQAVSDLFWSTETLCRTCFGHYPASWLLALYLLSLCVHMCTCVTKEMGSQFCFKSRVWHLHELEAGIWRHFDCLKCILFHVSSFLPEGNWTILLNVGKKFSILVTELVTECPLFIT